MKGAAYVVGVLLLFVGPLLAATGGYSTTELPLPAGSEGWGEAHDINELGWVVGYTHPTNQDYIAVWRPDGSVAVRMRPPGWQRTYGHGINDELVVAGDGRLSTAGDQFFTLDVATNSFQEHIINGWSRTYVPWGDCINNAGTVIGWGGNASGYPRGFVWTEALGDEVETLSPPGCDGVLPWAINEGGTIAGWGGPFDSQGFGVCMWTRDGSGFQVPTLPAGWTHVVVHGINESNVVVGAAKTADGTRAFTWSAADGFTLIPVPAGWSGAYGFAISDNGSVAIKNPTSGYPREASVWHPTCGLMPIDRLGAAQVNPRAMDSRGRVVGYLEGFGGNTNDPHHPFVAAPANSAPIAVAGGPYGASVTSAYVDVDPNTLNINSNGKWVTAYFTVDPGGTALVQLDGSGSHDPDGDPLVGYHWLVTEAESADEIAELEGISPLIELPPGEYVVGLVVDDGELLSTNDAFAPIAVSAPDLQAVDPTAVVLNGAVSGEWGQMQDAATLMVKFSRELLVPTLIPEQENLIEVSGALTGADTIMVIDRGGKGKKRK